jgi:hypothetical protein
LVTVELLASTVAEADAVALAALSADELVSVAELSVEELSVLVVSVDELSVDELSVFVPSVDELC